MAPTIVRKCGNLEHYSTARHNLGFYRGIANSCQYEITTEQLRGRPAQKVVEEAVARVILRLDGLRVGISGEDTKQAYFVQVPSIDLQDFIEWKKVTAAEQALYDEQVLQVIKNRLEQLWPDIVNRPPWQLLVVENTLSSSDLVVLDVVFTSHHALADGKSTLLFHETFLEELNRPSAPVPKVRNHILTCDEPPRLAPSQDDLVQFKISWPFYLKTLWGEFGPAWLKPTPQLLPWTGKVVTLEPQRLNLRLVPIGAKTVQRLLAACRAHETTISGLLHALVLASLARRVPAHEASSFAGETAISLLPWAQPPSSQADLDLTKMLTDLNTGTHMQWDAATVGQLRSCSRQSPAENNKFEETVFWPLAKAWRETMKAKLATIPNDDVVGLMQYIRNYNNWALQKVGKPRSSTWALSNIGTIKGTLKTDNQAHAAWRINRALFSQPVSIIGAGIAVNVVGVVDGPVNAVLSWQDTIIDETIVDGLVEDLGAWLERFENDGNFGVFGGGKTD
ncbi:hypothetical protein BD289DRAFT_445106 [Coniella lustricola]|uniref:Alcohol acetyltransferase n=1 Tax=Coniella lustricola TaxID=2025994 RepID=A0A2T2ZVA8_9PEZI|nr:hypothetical protein BD289DRAFT_445106 [Coniella lustricola]